MSTAAVSRTSAATAGTSPTPQEMIKDALWRLYGDSTCELGQTLLSAVESPEPTPLIAARVTRLVENPNDPARAPSDLFLDSVCLARLSELLSDLRYRAQAIRVAQESIRVLSTSTEKVLPNSVNSALAKLGLEQALSMIGTLPQRNQNLGGLAYCFALYEKDMPAARQCIEAIPEGEEREAMIQAYIPSNCLHEVFPDRPEIPPPERGEISSVLPEQKME